MSTELKIRAMDAVLPTALITRMKKEEKAMMAAATLVFNLIRETIHYVGNKLPRGLDAYPGDLNCQGRVTLLPELFEKKEVCQELQGLAEKIKAKLQILKERRREQSCSCSEFYEKEIATLEVSSDVRYLMDCRLLMITRATQSIKPNGIIMSMTDHGKLSVLSPKFHEIENRTLGNNFREQITQKASTRISAETMVRLQDLSRRRKIPELLQRMIGQVVVFQPENYPPKTFGCSCFTLQLALLELLEKKISLAFKTIVTKGDPRLIFFKAHENDFEFQDLNEARQLPKTAFVAIFLAVVPSEDRLIAKVKEIGFIELMLQYTSQEAPPFQHKSSLEDVKDPEAYKLLEEYRKKAAASGCNKDLLEVQHLYLNTFQEEVK